MQKESIGKVIGLVLVVIMFFTVLTKPDLSEVAISKDAHFHVRFLYHFFHVSLLHFFLNAWCFLSLLFYFRIRLTDLAVAYIIASLTPVIGDIPTVGFSGVCYALMGILSLRVDKKVRFVLLTFVLIFIGTVSPLVNGKIHLWSYLAGMFYALLTEPICKMK